MGCPDKGTIRCDTPLCSFCCFHALILELRLQGYTSGRGTNGAVIISKDIARNPISL